METKKYYNNYYKKINANKNIKNLKKQDEVGF